MNDEREQENIERKEIFNISTEIIIVGSLYKQPDLCITYCPYIRSQYDFFGEDTRFFYDMCELMYNTYSQTLDENKINAFMLEDAERMKLYRKYGGFKYLKNARKLADVEDIAKHYDVLKKYSLLREYTRKDFDVTKIMQHRNFPQFNASTIVDLIHAKMDKINTVILSNKDSKLLTDGAIDKLDSFLLRPQMGILSPWDCINSCFSGLQLTKTLLLGFLSNEGKSRNLMLLMAHLALLNNEKVLIMSNEMSEDALFSCLLVTVINNPQFQELHGVHISKPEKEVVKGIYRDDEGNIISRKMDFSTGQYIEEEQDYLNRVKSTSSEYRKIRKITEWLEEKQNQLIYFKDMGEDYSDKTIAFEIRKHKSLYGVKYFGYDTLKGYQADDWMLLKQTATKLQELGKELEIFIWAVFQLTDDALYVDVFDLSSNNIANAKQIYHVADCMLMGKKIDEEDYYKYAYTQIDEDYGSVVQDVPLRKGKNYFAMKVVKNRMGEKGVILFEYDLNLNTWCELGFLHKVQFEAKKKSRTS